MTDLITNIATIASLVGAVVWLLNKRK